MSHAFVIEGGRALQGEVGCSGAGKNSALKILAGCLLAPGTSRISRVPDIADVRWFADVLRHMGCQITHTDGVVELTVPDALGVEAPYEFVSRMRASTAVLGPLLAREGRAHVALPGGDLLGPRPIDIHLRGLEQLGADVRVAHGYVEASCTKLRGTLIHLDYPSHGATENLMIAAALAEGQTILENASREPEICDLAQCLNGMGARIADAGETRIVIDGVDTLRPATYEVMPDRLEAATFMFATAAATGEVVVKDMNPAHLDMVFSKLTDMGASLDIGDDRVKVTMNSRPRPVDISTLPYPGFPTDLQPMAVATLALADGLSIVTENIYDSRFTYADELARMGADIRIEGHYAVIRGVSELTGAPVRAYDVSAGAALVMSGLHARGRTIVEDIIHIDRRYENLEGKFASLGANVRRVPASDMAPA